MPDQGAESGAPAQLPTESEPEADRSPGHPSVPWSHGAPPGRLERQGQAGACIPAKAGIQGWWGGQGLSVVLCASVLLLAGAVVRLLYLGEIPAGLWTDEASVGYEAWSLLHHGIDRNGYAWPVHFVAWGSGQSVLYSYLSIPLIAVFDLSGFSIRLLMALTGTASLLLFWRVAARDQPALWSSPPPPSVPWSPGASPGRPLVARGARGRQGQAGACIPAFPSSVIPAVC